MLSNILLYNLSNVIIFYCRKDSNDEINKYIKNIEEIKKIMKSVDNSILFCEVCDIDNGMSNELKKIIESYNCISLVVLDIDNFTKNKNDIFYLEKNMPNIICISEKKSYNLKEKNSDYANFINHYNKNTLECCPAHSSCHGINKCCICLDKRPFSKDGLYKSYKDGRTTSRTVPREHYYCPSCKILGKYFIV